MIRDEAENVREERAMRVRLHLHRDIRLIALAIMGQLTQIKGQLTQIKRDETSMDELFIAFNKKTALMAKQGLALMFGSVRSALLGISASALAFAVSGNPVAFAQEYGTSASPTFDAKAIVHSLSLDAVDAVGAVLPAPAMVWTNANYGTGGVALRNRAVGSIGVSGVVGAAKAAFIYWAVIGPNALSGSIIVQRRSPQGVPPSASVTLTGAAVTVVGVGPNPCWVAATTPITVYRAAIPLVIATGNGDYEVRLLPGAGPNTGADPWVGVPVPPLWEGASIVIVGTGGGTVNLFDLGFAGATFTPPFSYSLTLTASATTFLWDNIGADGQIGGFPGRAATASVSGETTTINGVLVAGPGSAFDLTGDWNGSSGFPLPQLWDDTGHQFTLPAAASTLNITFGPATV